MDLHSKYEKHAFICMNERDVDNPKGDCAKRGAHEIRSEFVRLVNKHGLKGKVRINKSGCLGTCEIGPSVVIYPKGIWYNQISVNDVEEIFEYSILRDGIVERLKSSANI